LIPSVFRIGAVFGGLDHAAQPLFDLIQNRLLAQGLGRLRGHTSRNGRARCLWGQQPVL